MSLDARAHDGPSVGQVLRRAADYLERHGVEEPDASAERLLLHILRTDRAQLSAGAARLRPDQARAFGRALCRRCSGTPVHHLTGETGFRHLVLSVHEGVFVPRPETEVLVDRVLDLLGDRVAPEVVDVGTGAGPIALSIKDERPDARVTAIDASMAAVDLARDNAAALGLDVVVVQGDLLQGFAPAPTLDAVVSNPPYIAAADYEGLAPEVKADPYEALVGDLGTYRTLADEAADRLAPGGVIAVEIGETLGPQVTEIMGAAGFVDVRTSPDLAGRDRVVTARAPA